MRKNMKQLRTRMRMRMRIRMMMTMIMSIKTWKKKVKKKIVLNTRRVKLIIVESAKVSLTLCFFFFFYQSLTMLKTGFCFSNLCIYECWINLDLFIWFRGECNKFHFHPWLKVFFLKIMNLTTNVYLGKYIFWSKVLQKYTQQID